jgi:hypothetical protein
MCEGVHALVASIEGQATQSNLLISDILRVYSGIQLEVLTGLVSAIPEGHAIGVVLLVAVCRRHLCVDKFREIL